MMNRLHQGLVLAGMDQVTASCCMIHMEQGLKSKRMFQCDPIHEVTYIPLCRSVNMSKPPTWKLIRDEDDASVIYCLLELHTNTAYAQKQEDKVVNLPKRSK